MSDILILDEETKDESKKGKNLEGINKEKSKNIIDSLNDLFISMQSIKTKEKILFYRLLATMTNAGMSLIKSIKVLEKQEKNPVFKKILVVFYSELKKGKQLSECLTIYPNSFSEAEVGIIKSGEKTGQLNIVLLELSAQIEKVESLSGKIRSAMMYPMFILVVVIGVVSTLMIAVVPKLLEIFDSKDDLPASTQLLMSISDAFKNHWLLGIIILIVLYVTLSIWKKTADGKYIWEGFLLKVPVFGGINKKIVLSKFSRIFSGLISSGISIVESLKITASGVGNEVYKQRILLLAQDVSSGIKIWESLDGDPLFPEMMIQMIQIGEQTAKLDQTIVKVADFYDEEVDNTIAVLNKLLEPFIIVTLAGIVGFIAVAIMQPIMNLADTISSK